MPLGLPLITATLGMYGCFLRIKIVLLNHTTLLYLIKPPILSF